jgi:hypothetical protein
MTLPIAIKWLLVHEDPVTGVITLGRGVPHECLEPGRMIGVSDAPTRRGRVSYCMTSRIDDGEVLASVTLPERPGAEIRLRIRAPESFALVSAKVTNRDDVELVIEADCIVFPLGAGGTLAITTHWMPHGRMN